jgi:hypothetical protein
MTIELGWWIPEQEEDSPRRRLPRWVLASTETGILYSKGDRQHLECKQTTFQRWAARVNAKRVSKQ